MNKISLPCSCGDCGDWQIMMTSEGQVSYRCRNCGKEYGSIEEILQANEEDGGKLKMNDRWEEIIKKVIDFAYEFDDLWEGEYAILLNENGEDVDFQKLPSSSENFWGKELPWTKIGKIEGKGTDGMIIDLKYDDFEFHDEGYYNLPLED